MRVAITFRSQAEHERCSNEDCYAFLGRREPEPLPHFIEFETPALANHEYTEVYLFVAAAESCVEAREFARGSF